MNVKVSKVTTKSKNGNSEFSKSASGTKPTFA
jgi:hypothetical protein